MRNLRSVLTTKTPILLLWLLTGIIVAAEPEVAKPNSDAAARESAARLVAMRRRAMSVAVETEAASGQMVAAKVIETPLLRYSNQAAAIITADATVWAWGQAGRPAAMASLEEAGLEIVSLVDHPVTLTGKSGLKWTAAKSEIVWKEVPKAPAPATSVPLRTRQMKEISKRFSAVGHYGNGSGDEQLRLLERNLHRYSDPDKQIVDGAIFAFAAGTNPEVIVLIECRESAEQRLQWYYGVTRLSAGGLEAKLDGRDAWKCEGISSWNPKAPYWSSQFGKEDTVPESDLLPRR